MQTEDDCYQALVEGMPDGFGVQDLRDPDGFGPELRAIGSAVFESCVTPFVQLRLDVNLRTASAERLARWEEILGSRPRPSATLDQRRSGVIARLRERGPMTVRKLQAVLGTLLDYADPSQLEILEVDRDVLRAAHTYPAAGLPATPSLTRTIVVFDDAKVSIAGAQIDLRLTTTDIGALLVQITSPDGRVVTKSNLARGAITNGDLRVYVPEMAGAVVEGAWTITVSSGVPMATVSALALFVEGAGRTGSDGDGLGATIFNFAVIADPTKMGPLADLAAARDALTRITHATRRGALVIRPAAGLAAYPDLPLAIPDAFLPGV